MQLTETLYTLNMPDCKMQEGSLRCDVNLSVRPAGAEEEKEKERIQWKKEKALEPHLGS